MLSTLGLSSDFREVTGDGSGVTARGVTVFLCEVEGVGEGGGGLRGCRTDAGTLERLALVPSPPLFSALSSRSARCSFSLSYTSRMLSEYSPNHLNNKQRPNKDKHLSGTVCPTLVRWLGGSARDLFPTTNCAFLCNSMTWAACC